MYFWCFHNIDPLLHHCCLRLRGKSQILKKGSQVLGIDWLLCKYWCGKWGMFGSGEFYHKIASCYIETFLELWNLFRVIGSWSRNSYPKKSFRHKKRFFQKHSNQFEKHLVQCTTTRPIPWSNFLIPYAFASQCM